MVDHAGLNLAHHGVQAPSLSEAISLLQSGAADEGLSVPLGDKLIVFSAEEIAMTGVLQRLLGLQRVLNTLTVPQQDTVQPLRSGKPVLHPRVAEILDALR